MSILTEDSNGSLSTFFTDLQKQVSEEDRINNEQDLRLAQGKQRMEHKNRRLEIELERSKGQNENLLNDTKLKSNVAFAVFALLYIETGLMFTVVLLQGFEFRFFKIDALTLNILVPATIVQVSTMAIIVTQHLFYPKTTTKRF